VLYASILLQKLEVFPGSNLTERKHCQQLWVDRAENMVGYELCMIR